MNHPKLPEPMPLAFAEAESAGQRGEVPIGCVIVDQSGNVMAKAGNRTIELMDPTAHAELLAIREAAGKLGSERLSGCDLYVTLEPCAMCAGAIMHARVRRLVFGARDPKTGACGSVIDLFAEARLNHHTRVTGELLATECGALLSAFFAARRANA